jgi:transposase
MSAEPLALLAAVSKEGGLEASVIFEKSVNSQRFIEFLNEIARLHEGSKVSIFMDNLAVHHSKMVQAHMKGLDIKSIFNVPYSPQYNAIELVFSLIKRNFKKLRLASVSKDERFNFKDGIR